MLLEHLTMTIPVGSLFQYLANFIVKKRFLMSNLNFPWHIFVPFPPYHQFPRAEPGISFCFPSSGAAERSEVISQCLFLQINSPSASASPNKTCLPALLQFCCPLLDNLKDLKILFILWSPKLYTIFKVRLHKCCSGRIISYDCLTMLCLTL